MIKNDPTLRNDLGEWLREEGLDGRNFIKLLTNRELELFRLIIQTYYNEGKELMVDHISKFFIDIHDESK